MNRRTKVPDTFNSLCNVATVSRKLYIFRVMKGRFWRRECQFTWPTGRVIVDKLCEIVMMLSECRAFLASGSDAPQGFEAEAPTWIMEVRYAGQD